MSTTFRYSGASDFHQPLGSSNKNNVFGRNNSTISSTNSLISNNSDTGTDTTTTTTSTTTTNNVKRMHSSLISKYNSNRSTIFTNDTDSLSSFISYDTSNNSTIASSISPNSPANHHSYSTKHQLPPYMMNKSPQYIHQSTSRHSNLNHNNNTFLYNTYSNHSNNSHQQQQILNEDLVTLNSSMDNLEDGFYKLIRLDTRISFESYYVEQRQDQYKVKLQLNKHQIDLLRYTWNQMLLEESNEEEEEEEEERDGNGDEDDIEENVNAYYSNNDNNIPGAFPTGFANSRRKIIKRKSTRNVNGNGSNTNTMTRLDSTTIASSLFCRQLYFNLLSKDQTLEKMFPSIKHQAANMAGILSLTISQLENLSNLDEYLSKLGKLHSRILNIEECHFKLMGEAFVQTFQERFGSKFTKELENLWIKLYLYIANTLLQTGIDPILKLTRYELNGSFTTSTNIDLTNGDSIILDDNISINDDNISVSNILDPKHLQQHQQNHPRSYNSSFNQDDNDNDNDNGNGNGNNGVHPTTNTVVLTKSNILIIESVTPHHQQQQQQQKNNNSGSSNIATSSKKTKFSIRKKKKENCVVM